MRQSNPVTSTVRQGFKSVFSLTNECLAEIGAFVNDNIDAAVAGEIDEGSLDSLATKLNISKLDIARAISLVLTILMNTRGGISQFDEIAKEIGIDGNSRPKVEALLAPVTVSPERVVTLRQAQLFSNTAISTLSDVDIVCDLRAVFRRFPSASKLDKHADEVKTLIGFEPIAIISLELSDPSGNDLPTVFQLSEPALRNLIKTFEQGLAQLEIAKQKLPQTP